MTFVLGALLAAGMLLVATPWLWPPRASDRPVERDGPLARLVAEAGLRSLRPRGVIVVMAVCAAVAAAIAWLVLGVPILAGVAAVSAGCAPLLWLQNRREQLVRARRGLWPDVCDHLVAAVRAGQSLPDAVANLAGTAPEPLRPAFAGFARDLAASGHFDSSALRLKNVLADPVADRIVETLRMAREVGGTELTTVLRALSVSVRADAALRGEVEARQSWIRGAAILGAIAPWVIVALLSLRPEGARAYSSPQGVALVVLGGIASIVAFRLMLRIGKLPVPRRWLA